MDSFARIAAPLLLIITQRFQCEGKLSYDEVIDYIHGPNSTAYRHPYDVTGNPVIVSLGMYITNLQSLKEDSMELEMDLYFKFCWTTTITLPPDSGWDDGIELRYGPGWSPDFFSPNARTFDVAEVGPSTNNALLFPNGTLSGSILMQMITRCNMDLSAFPFDSQICDIKFESLRDTNEKLKLIWMENAVEIDPSTYPVAFHYISKRPDLQKGTTSKVNGEVDTLVLKLHFKRMSSHYVLLIYVPSTLIVILGGVLFWLPQGALAERTSYSAFLFLAMVVLSVGGQYGIPQVGYVKAIDAWCGACIFFLFTAIAEVLILHLLRAHQYQQTANSFHEMKEEPEDVHEQTRDTSFLTSRLVLFRNPRVVQWIDRILRALYPAAFLVFVIVYAAVYHT